jgi:hypothetical protein
MLRIAGNNTRELTLPFGDKMKFLIGLLLVTLSLFANADEKVSIKHEQKALAKNIKLYEFSSNDFSKSMQKLGNCEVLNINSDSKRRKSMTRVYYIDSSSCFTQDVNSESNTNKLYAKNIKLIEISTSDFSKTMQKIGNCEIINLDSDSLRITKSQTRIYYIKSNYCNESLSTLKKEEQIEIEKSQDFGLGILFGMLILGTIYFISRKYLKSKKGDVNESST